MSDIFDDIGNAVRRAADQVTTGISVASLNQQISDAYKELGRMHHQAAKEGKPLIGPEFARKLNLIEDLQRQVKEKKG